EDMLVALRDRRYEYSFTVDAPDQGGVTGALEYAYSRQGNNDRSSKVRMDRQSMSPWDAAVVGDIQRFPEDATAYLCGPIGFYRVPGLVPFLLQLIEASWDGWNKDVPAHGPNLAELRAAVPDPRPPSTSRAPA